MLTRSARFGFLSPDDIAYSRFEARGDIDICIGFPDPSVRGFCTACAGWAADGSDVVANVLREARCGESCGVVDL